MSDLVIKLLSQKEIEKAFSSLLQQYFFLEPISEGESIFMGATLQGIPVGLLSAQLIPSVMLAEVHSLYVLPEFRKQKIATKLLNRLYEELVQKQFKICFLSYRTHEANSHTIENLLNKLDWQGPRLHVVECLFDALQFRPLWFQRQYKLLEGFTIFPWYTLTQYERDHLLRLEEQRIIPASVSPFIEEDTQEPLNSLGLRHKGQVIGWMITHRLAKDKLRYTALYVHRKWQYSGIAIQLLQKSILLQQQARVQWSSLRVNVLEADTSWLHFLERRLIPYAQQVTYIKQFWKVLKKDTHLHEDGAS